MLKSSGEDPHLTVLRIRRLILKIKAAKYEIKKTPKLVSQHCSVVSFGSICFVFFTLRDQLVAQQITSLRVEESCCEK